MTWAQELDPTLQQVIDTRGAARVAGDADEWGRHVTDDYILIGPAFFRYKSIVGSGLRARSPGGRATEALLACIILNHMTELGRPESYGGGR